MTTNVACISITLTSSSKRYYESGETIEGSIHLYLPDTTLSTAPTTIDIDSVFNHVELSLVGEELIDIGYHDNMCGIKINRLVSLTIVSRYSSIPLRPVLHYLQADTSSHLQ
jgi:hypothetical protein